MALIAQNDRLPMIQRLAPAACRFQGRQTLPKRQGGRITPRDAAEMGEQRGTDRGGMKAIGFALERARGNAAVDPLHDEERPFQRPTVRLKHNRLGYRHGAEERLVGKKFNLPIGIDQASDGIASQDQPLHSAVGLRVEAVGFAADATWNPGEVMDPYFVVPQRRQKLLQPGTEAIAGPERTHGAKSLAEAKPEGWCGPSANCSSTPRP